MGSEILSTHDRSMAEILSKIYPQISAERPYFKNAKLELYSFPRYYWQVYGRQDVFNVEIRQDGTVKKYSLNAVSLLEGYEMKRTEVLNTQMGPKLFERSAYLNTGNFSGDEQKHRHFIDSAFVKIKESKSKNLIIDFRDNRGGDDSFSDYLVSCFADRPFKWNSSKKIVAKPYAILYRCFATRLYCPTHLMKPTFTGSQGNSITNRQNQNARHQFSNKL